MTYLDIETAPDAGIEEFIESAEAPANYKDPEKIAAYIDAAKRKQIERAALKADLLRIIAIGTWTPPMAPLVLLIRHPDGEAGVLDDVIRVKLRFPVIGFNIRRFDAPALVRRCQLLHIEAPNFDFSRRSSTFVDLMEELTFGGTIEARSLDTYCRRFGIPKDPADTITGEDVPRLVAEGTDAAWTLIHNHCYADLLKTRGLAQRVIKGLP